MSAEIEPAVNQRHPLRMARNQVIIDEKNQGRGAGNRLCRRPSRQSQGRAAGRAAGAAAITFFGVSHA